MRLKSVQAPTLVVSSPVFSIPHACFGSADSLVLTIHFDFTVQVRSLLKRADSWSTFGSCDVGTSILVPPWPNAKAFQLQKLVTDGKVQQDQWWYRVNQKSCPEVSEIYYDATFLRGQPLTQVNVDHACKY